MIAPRDQGFTVVELVITLIVGLLFIITTSQIYSVVLTDSANARNRANASNIAYAEARTVLAGLSTTCRSATLTLNSNGTYPPLPDLTSLPQPASITAVVTCPFATGTFNAAASRLTVTVTYGPNSEQIKHVLYKY